ncbi:hypothetical protein Poli38472_005603 [Pythium oligandrum]|uniref:Serine protease n=1 Tax=Pythium oligandrum TaxID=41045 RepID=A0A8K1FGP2_PYTOL|nr:hypothetical protein Poli38472_005603 [Pythium oligandrum]|eukprot:TMW62985.1 hypothetical protein Poli38472_005603 [Pythium oligandrum]
MRWVMRRWILAFFYCLIVIAAGQKSVKSAPVHGFGIRHINISAGCSTESDGAFLWENISYGIQHLDAQFLVFRFAHLRLPPGATVTIRDGSQHEATPVFQFDATSRHGKRLYTKPLRSHQAVIEYTIDTSAGEPDTTECYGFLIDQYRYAAQGVYRTPSQFKYERRLKASNTVVDHWSSDEILSGSTSDDPGDIGDAEALANQENGDSDDECVSSLDESEEAACTRRTPTVFELSNPVARLLVHKESGSIFCTGWMFGCEGHIMTNHHCVADQSEANSTVIEFLAQGPMCKYDCEEPLGCPGVIEATSSEIIMQSGEVAMDFTLLLPRLSAMERLNLTRKYGFLTMRSTPAVFDERIFIPQHPAGFGKRVASKHAATYGRVVSLTEPGCNGNANSVGYFLDTSGGSSGAPVISYQDNSVIGLHYCGGCMNSAIPANHIVQTLIDASKLPRCAQSEFHWTESGAGGAMAKRDLSSQPNIYF